MRKNKKNENSWGDRLSHKCDSARKSLNELKREEAVTVLFVQNADTQNLDSLISSIINTYWFNTFVSNNQIGIVYITSMFWAKTHFDYTLDKLTYIRKNKLMEN